MNGCGFAALEQSHMRSAGAMRRRMQSFGKRGNDWRRRPVEDLLPFDGWAG